MSDEPQNDFYIRTYAKDVAKLSGTPPPVSAPPEPQKNPEPENLPPPGPSPAFRPEPGPEAESARSAILERLRAKAAPVAAVVTQPPPAPVPLPEPPPAPTPVPVPTPQPLPTPPPPAPVVEASSSPLHTYKSDFADHIDTREASTFAVLAAQGDAPRALAEKRAVITPKKNRKGLITIGVGVALMLVGGGGAYATYRYLAQQSFVPFIPTVPSLVFADSRKVLTGTGKELYAQLADTSALGLGNNTVIVTYLTEASTTARGASVDVPLSGGALIQALGLPAPDILLRNIEPASTVGIISAGGETHAFFILRVSSYERTFAGMLDWERTIASDLSELYPPYPAPVFITPAATSTPASSTPQIMAPKPPRFVDVIVASHDARALKDGTDRTVLMYGYKDKQTLIIARDEAAYTELVRRLSATQQR